MVDEVMFYETTSEEVAKSVGITVGRWIGFGVSTQLVEKMYGLSIQLVNGIQCDNTTGG